MHVSDMQKEIHTYAKDKGWWDNPRPLGDLIALIHTEISEAFEEYRGGHDLTEVYYEHTDHGNKPCGFPTELADAVIRILDVCEFYGIDLETVIAEKHAFNQRRPFRHGNKLA